MAARGRARARCLSLLLAAAMPVWGAWGRPSAVTQLAKTSSFEKQPRFLLKLMPKTGSTYTSKVLNRVLKKYFYVHDTASLPLAAHTKDFVAITMRNPCDMYVSLCHYGGAPGHAARPFHTPWYGVDAAYAANPVPNYNSKKTSPKRWKNYTHNQILGTRHNIPPSMMVDYIYAARRKASHVGFYSHVFWDQVVAPECWLQHFIDKGGTKFVWEDSADLSRFKDKLTPGDIGAKKAAYSKCYSNKHRTQVDLARWDPNKMAHCWIFQETLMEDLRECLEAYETSSPDSKGTVDWDAFSTFEHANTTDGGAGFQEFTDKSKNLAAADTRHSPCASYNPGLEKAVRFTDRWLLEKFGYSTCCGARTGDFTAHRVGAA